jgi:uncharacterized protein (DUF58 family)
MRAAPASAAAKLGIGLLIVAGVFDAEPLYVAGVAFLVLGVGCRAWVASGARGVHIGRSLLAARVVENEPLAVEIVLTGNRVALPSCIVEDPLLDAPIPIRGGRRTAIVAVEARFERRGRKRLDPPTAIVRDPLGLAEKAITGERRDEVLVLPRVEAIRLAPDGSGQAGAISRRTRPGVAPAAEVDIDGLRPHREGAPASRIHWAAFARTGQLLERRLRPEGDTRPLVLLDPRCEAPEDLDAAVRAAASLCVHLAQIGGCALLLPGERRPTPLEPGLSGWPHLHARLAVVEGGGPPALTGLAQRRGAIFYIAARRVQRVPPVLAHAPAAGRVLVVPGTLPGRRMTFEVAGCTGYDLAPARPRRRVVAA